MKICPRCNLTYSNDKDDVYCTADGVPLMPYSDGGQNPSRFSVSVNPAPEIVPRPQPPAAPPSSDTSKWLYLVIGMMASIILGMGIFVFLSLNPKEKEAVNVSIKTAEETPKYENVSLPNRNTAPIISEPIAATPENTPKSNMDSDFPNESNTKRVGSYLPRNFRRTYEGTVNYDEVEMRLERSGSILSGKVIPKYRYADISIRGDINDNGSFTMTEYSDTNAVTGVYRGQINADGTMEGRWEKPDGSKPRPFSMRLTP